MPELNDEDRERWFAACEAVTAAQERFEEENRRYFPARWAGEQNEEPEALDGDALKRLSELDAAERSAIEARVRIGQELSSKLGR